MHMKCVTSTVQDGNMSTVWEPEEQKEQAVERMRVFAQKHGFTWENVVFMSLPLPFGNSVMSVTSDMDLKRDQYGRKLAVADALVTNDSTCALALLTADCLPVAFESEDIGMIGLAHCGRESIDKHLAGAVFTRLVAYGAQPKKMMVSIGPSIRKESYIFDPENFKQKDDPAWQPYLHHRPDGKFHVDLLGYLLDQLVTVGIPKENISVSSVDTAADPHYFSHYRSVVKKEPEGRFVTIIGQEKE